MRRSPFFDRVGGEEAPRIGDVYSADMLRVARRLALIITILSAGCAEPPSKEMNQAQGAIDAARAASHQMEQAAKVANQLAPSLGAQFQSLQNCRSLLGGAARLSRSKLAGCPVEQLDVGLGRHRQKAPVAGTRPEAAGTGPQFVAEFIDAQRCQEAVRAWFRLAPRSLLQARNPLSLSRLRSWGPPITNAGDFAGWGPGQWTNLVALPSGHPAAAAA